MSNDTTSREFTSEAIKREALERVGEQIDWDRVRGNGPKAEVYRAINRAYDEGAGAIEEMTQERDSWKTMTGSASLRIDELIAALRSVRVLIDVDTDSRRALGRDLAALAVIDTILGERKP